MGCRGGSKPPMMSGPGEQYGQFIESYSKYGDERKALAREELEQQIELQSDVDALRKAQLQGIAGLQDEYNLAYESEQDRLLREELGRQVFDELSLGKELDPALRREVQQAIRASQEARGMGRGFSDYYDEVLNVGLEADALGRRRQGQAMEYLRNQSATRPSILNLLGGEVSGAGQFASGGGRNFDSIAPGMVQMGMQSDWANKQNWYNYQQRRDARKAQAAGAIMQAATGDFAGVTGVNQGAQNAWMGV